jgi:hypothetical protein
MLASLADMGFAPFAVVDEVGMKLIKSLDFEYVHFAFI